MPHTRVMSFVISFRNSVSRSEMIWRGGPKTKIQSFNKVQVAWIQFWSATEMALMKRKKRSMMVHTYLFPKCCVLGKGTTKSMCTVSKGWVTGNRANFPALIGLEPLPSWHSRQVLQNSRTSLLIPDHQRRGVMMSSIRSGLWCAIAWQ